MMIRLLTLKSEPVKRQIEIIELFAQNADLGRRVQGFIKERYSSSVLVQVAKDTRKVAQVALLAIVAADILTVPDRATRERYQRTLEKVCDHFEVDLLDVSFMLRYVSAIEEML